MLLAVVLGFLSNLVSQETIKAITINLASELLSVSVIFFIINRLFLLGDDDSKDRNSSEILNEINAAKNATTQHNLIIKEQGNRLEQALNFLVSRIERIGNSSEENAKILEAIRSESTLADKVQERIQINDRLTTLSEQLKNTESLLAEKDRERAQVAEKLHEQFLIMSQQVKTLEVTLTKTFNDVGEQLRVKQELLIRDVRDTINSSQTKDNISAEVKRNLPVLMRPNVSPQIENPETVSNALTNKIVDAYTREVSATLDGLRSELSNSYDEAAYSRRKQLLDEIERIKLQLKELGRAT